VTTRRRQPADRSLSAQRPKRVERVAEPVALETVRKGGRLAPTTGALDVLPDATPAQPRPPTAAPFPVSTGQIAAADHDSDKNSDLSSVFFTRSTDSCHPFGWRPPADPVPNCKQGDR
jgi:hypothetical protein